MTESSPPLFKASLTVPKERVADMYALLELTPPPPQAIIVTEDPFLPDSLVEALYIDMPDCALLSNLTDFPVTAAPLPDQNWIKLSQEGLPPVRAGRFFVYGAHDAGEVPHGVLPIRIEAGMAFGTGHHETTALCLAALSDLAKVRRFSNVLDLGCGTGLLAIGAAKLWHRRVLATDIDPIAVEVTRENARANNEGPNIIAATAEGMESPVIREKGKFDLILANILAGPLTQLAPAVSRALAPGAMLVLSGLLRWQEDIVLSFYRSQGLIYRSALRERAWTALVLEKPRRRR